MRTFLNVRASFIIDTMNAKFGEHSTQLESIWRALGSLERDTFPTEYSRELEMYLAFVNTHDFSVPDNRVRPEVRPLICIGTCYFEKGDFDLALKYLQNAFEILIPTIFYHDHYAKRDCFSILNRTYLVLTQSDRFDTCREDLMKVGEMLRSNEHNFQKVKFWEPTLNYTNEASDDSYEYETDSHDSDSSDGPLLQYVRSMR